MIIKFTKIISTIDPISNVSFVQYQCDAKELSGYLKESLRIRGINPQDFNSSGCDFANNIPPLETYCYQNFYLLQDGDEYLLMDGFRRLLWWDTPSVLINVFVYQKASMSSSQILELMLNLNQHKFYSNQNYFDRGFALFMGIVFGLKILDYKEAFDGYLNYSETTKTISNWDNKTGTHKNQETKKRLLGDTFISDMQFIQDSNAIKNKFFGALVYKSRQGFKGKLDTIQFNTLMASKLSMELHEKAKNIPSNDERGRKLFNQISELYGSYLGEIMGISNGPTYAEQLEFCKSEVSKFKKDKTLIKLSGRKDTDIEDAQMRALIEAGVKLEFKCVVYPKELDSYQIREKDKIAKIPYGTYEDVRFDKIKKWKKSYDIHVDELIFIVTIDEVDYKILHVISYDGYYSSYSRKYGKISNHNNLHFSEQKIDFFWKKS